MGETRTADATGGYVVSIRDSARVNHKRFTKVNHYGRIPREVLADRSLSAEAKVVYACLALTTFQGSVAYIGQRLIGEILGCSQASVSRRLRELERAGHIKQNDVGRGRRSFWELTSQVFGQKQGRETVVVSAPRGGRRYASVNREEVA